MQMQGELSPSMSAYSFESKKSNELHILVASRDKKALDELSSILAGVENCKVTSNLILNGNSNPLLGLTASPDIIVYKVSDQWREELTDLPKSLAGLKVEKIIVSDNEEQECMRMAIHAGAKDFISPPLTTTELIESIRRLRAEMGSLNKKGGLISVINAKGGCGATFIASNVAHMMSAISKLNVVLLDLDLQFGTLCHYLNMEPQRGLMEAIQHIEDMDEVALHAYLLKHESGLKILETNPQGVSLAEDIPDKKLRTLVDLLLSCHDEVIVDLPRQIDMLTSTVLERSDKIMVVLQQDITAIRDATRLIKILRSELGISDEKIQVVVNRYSKNSSITLADIEKALKTKDVQLIPNDFINAHECVDAGIPLYEHNKKAPSTRAIMALETSLGGRSCRQNSGLMNRVSSYFKRS